MLESMLLDWLPLVIIASAIAAAQFFDSRSDTGGNAK